MNGHAEVAPAAACASLERIAERMAVPEAVRAGSLGTALRGAGRALREDGWKVREMCCAVYRSTCGGTV